MPRRIIDKTCEWCSAPFLGPAKQRFCSRQCGVESNKIVPRPCEQCGTPFVTKSKGYLGNPVRFCSKTCGGLSRRVIYPAKLCRQCEQPFTPERPEVQHCSPECYREFQVRLCARMNERFVTERTRTVRWSALSRAVATKWHEDARREAMDRPELAELVLEQEADERRWTIQPRFLTSLDAFVYEDGEGRTIGDACVEERMPDYLREWQDPVGEQVVAWMGEAS